MTNQIKRFIRMKRVLEKIPISSSTLWAWAASGRFPAPIKLGPRTTVWLESEVDTFIDNLAAENKNMNIET